jgi:hypothetical protein
MKFVDCVQAASITVIGIESVPFERVLGVELGAALQKWCEEKGLTFRMLSSVSRIVTDAGHAVGVELASGEVLPAQLVVAGIGAVVVRVCVRCVCTCVCSRDVVAVCCRRHRLYLVVVLTCLLMVASCVMTHSVLAQMCMLRVTSHASRCG